MTYIIFKPRVIILCAFFLVQYYFCFYSHSQEWSISDTPNCKIISKNAQKLITDYYEKKDFQNIDKVIQYWENFCGLSEPILRVKILLAIEAGNFSEDIYRNTPIIDFLNTYLTTILPLKNFDEDEVDFLLLPLGLEESLKFDSITDHFARRLKMEKEVTSIEKFLLNFYIRRNISLFHRLQRPSLENSFLANQYLQYPISSPFKIFSYFSGTRWVPTGNLSLIGPRFGFGLGSGFSKNKFSLEYLMSFAEGKSKNEFQILDTLKTNLLTADEFSLLHYALNIGYSLYKNKNLELISHLILGFDLTWYTEKVIPDNPHQKVSFISFSPGISLELRRYLTHRIYIGFDSRYYINNIKNEGGTDLSGNSILFSLKIGYIEKGKKN